MHQQIMRPMIRLSARHSVPRTVRRTSQTLTLIASLVAATTASREASAQAAPAQPAAVTLKVGDAAPDFTIVTVNANGRTAKPFRLSEHRGETVILAFFPKARTQGCTVQMESYRDQYAQLFRNGEKVTLIGVSTDADSSLVSWAKDARFPFLFGTDVSKEVGVAFGANNGTRPMHARHLYVIDPNGRIAYVATPFVQMSADAYTELGKAVAAAASAR